MLPAPSTAGPQPDVAVAALQAAQMLSGNRGRGRAVCAIEISSCPHPCEKTPEIVFYTNKDILILNLLSHL